MFKSSLKHFAKLLGFQISAAYPSTDLGYWLRPNLNMALAWLDLHEGSKSVVQIGAHDHDGKEPIARWVGRSDWNFLLVEPLPHLAKRLLERYQSFSNVRISEAAISEVNGSIRFYFPKSDYPRLLPQNELENFNLKVNLEVSSLYPEHIAHVIGWKGDPAVVVDHIEVQSLTLHRLLESHQIDSLDVLMIDAEGADFMLLRQIDFQKVKPKVLIFEHLNLGEEFQEAIAFLQHHQYLWSLDDMNIIAIDSQLYLKEARTPGMSPALQN